MFWTNNMNVVLRSYSGNHIDVGIEWESLNWRFTGCYAPSTPEERQTFWKLLVRLLSLQSYFNEPWLL